MIDRAGARILQQFRLRAAEDNASASRYDREVIALTTLVSVANAYFLVLEAQDRIRVANDNVAAAERILKVIRDRFAQGGAAPLGAGVGASGSGSALDVAQQESVVAAVRAQIPPVEQTLRQNFSALAVLIGRPPERFDIRGGSLDNIAIPRVTPGLPSELLNQRPEHPQGDREAARAADRPRGEARGHPGRRQGRGQGGQAGGGQGGATTAVAKICMSHHSPAVPSPLKPPKKNSWRVRPARRARTRTSRPATTLTC